MEYCILIALVIILLYCMGPSRSHFYTGYAIESPTRLMDVPYTGTEPLGVWGSAPWATTAYAMAPTMCGS